MLDEIGVRILRALQQDGRASWTQIAQMAAVPPSTAYRRGTALIENGDVRVAVLPTTEVHPSTARIYELLVQCRRGTQRAVAARLAARTDTRWVAVVTGQFDVAAEVVIPQGEDVAAVLLDDIQSDPDLVATQTALVLKSQAVANDWQPPMRPPGRALDGERFPHQCDESHMAGPDRAILSLLRDDGRRSYASIAAELEMNETTVRRRCTDLLRLGCATVITLVQPHLLGYEQEVQIRLDVLPQQLEAAMQTLARQPGVHYLATTFGAMSLVCEIRLKSHHDLYDFVRDVVSQVPGVTKMIAEVDLVVFKRAFVLCPWASASPPERQPLPDESEVALASLRQ
jgi:DNA-binding Lrp family transcriptional regulator